uniref:PWWP domain containing 2A n=1 Tax=Periophthalmus magnuspinnatus TaxID=409849 RepID=A0A3B4A2N4_9GOBI
CRGHRGRGLAPLRITAEQNGGRGPRARSCAAFSDKDEDRRHVTAATVSSEANANAEPQDAAPFSPRAEQPELPPLLRDSAAGKGLSDHGPGAEQDPVQSAVSPLSLPAAPEAPEAGLSLGQPNGPDHRAQDPAQDPAELPDSGSELRPGTQVRVSLDHVIDDALVVSFRVGHKVFSGVLMDLSRRFGPYGIPITTFPAHAPPPPAEDASPDPALTPLFHQGAPYPPPLFLRDTYHQSLPQPPPRRIKRSRRRYGNSEEPTCMLVRLRPRQVLCDRCKGAAGPRPTPSTRRRPNPEPLDENLPTEVKRLRCDDSRPARPRRDAPRTPGGGATAHNPAPRRPQSTSNSANHARDPRNRDREPARSSSLRSGSGLRAGSGLRSNPASGASAGTRVLTRRISSALSPPRIRLKPHRYRTEPEPSPPPPKTKSRPGPRLEPGPQRTNKNPKVQTKTPSRLQNRLQSRQEMTLLTSILLPLSCLHSLSSSPLRPFSFFLSPLFSY